MNSPEIHSALPLFDSGLMAGVDEAGRGPLAGPVVAAAVILPTECSLPGLGDSKTIPEKARGRLETDIRSVAVSWAVAWADPAEIDCLNILNATLLAMRRAVEGLGIQPRHVVVDGNRCPRLDCTAEAIVGGDCSQPAISAASILAKVARDRMMLRLAEIYPAYGLGRHKGYPTQAHVTALRRHGPSPVHRRSFRPVAELLGAARA
jgi:ribonuclease HII